MWVYYMIGCCIAAFIIGYVARYVWDEWRG